MRIFFTRIKACLFYLRSKARRPVIIGISFFTLAVGFLMYASSTKAVSWWTGGGGSWGARKQLTITNNSSASLSANTTVAITVDTSSLVASGKLRADCADLRVVYQPSSSTTTELTRHITFASTETGVSTCATSTATKVYFPLQASLASSGSSTSYYMYYKNLSATPPTSTDNAFDISSIDATLVCPFDGTTTCAAGETPSTGTGALRYSGSKSALSFVKSRSQDLTTSATLTSMNQFTIEFWMKPTILTANQRIGGIGSSNYLITTLGSGASSVIRMSGANVNTCDTAAISVNQWSHIAFSYDGTNLRCFANGSLSATTAMTGVINLGSTQAWGDNFGSGNGTYDGLFDEIRVSSVARYTTSFTPSTTPFNRDSATQILLHLDENGTDPRNTTKALDDSGNGYHATLTNSPAYVGGLVGVDASTSDTGYLSRQGYNAHEGLFIEEGTTNKITNPSFENDTYDTNWTTGSNLTATANTSAPFFKFGVKSAKLVASASAISGTSNMFTTNIDVGSSATHGFSVFVYDVTSGNVGGTVSSSIAKIVFQGVAQTTTYTDVGGGWWRLSYAASAAGAQEFGIEPQVSKTIYVDAAQLEAKTTQLAGYSTSYADGSMGSGYSWSGTANNSTSTRTAGDLRYATSGNISVSAGTFSAWVWYPSYYSSCSGSHQGILYTNGANPIFMGQNCGTAWFSVNGTNGGSASGTMPTYGTNKWHHYVGTWNGSALTFYIDGTAQTPGTYTATPTATSIILNTDIGGNTGIDTVSISDLRIYDTALTSTQVTDLYQAGLVGHSQGRQVDAYGDTKGEDPVGIYHMDEAQGTVLGDNSIYGNSFTLGTGSSAPSWETHTIQSNEANPRATNLVFDGSNDYAYRAYDTDFDPGTDSFSVSGFFRHSSAISGTDTILARYGSAGYKVYMNSSGYLCFGIDDDSSWGPDDSACSTSSQGSLADSKWHTYTAVKTSITSITLYIDGVLVGSDSSLAATATLNPGATIGTYFGIDSDFASNPWTGNLDEMYFYAFARSAAQIKSDVLNKKGATLGASSDPLYKGLVGYWKMNESSWNGTANEAVDSSGNANHGVRTGDATTAIGKFGNGGTFDGSGDYLTVTEASSLKPTNITVSGWVYSSTNTQWNTVLMKTSSTAWNDGYGLYLDGSNNLTFFINNYSANIAATSLTSATWTYITATYDGTAIKIYKNGDLSASTPYTTAISHSSADLLIGRSPTSAVSSWNGKLDDMRIYNRALSSKEIQQLYNFAPGPLAHWKLDDNAGTAPIDSSGNGYTATLGTGSSAPNWTTGKFGAGLSFDGANDMVSVGNTAPGVQTVSFWVNPTSTTQSILSLSSSAYVTASSGTLSATGFTSATIHVNGTISSTITANTWQHVAITTGTAISASALNFGKANGSFLSGKLDDIKLYNYARTTGQVVEDMNAGHPLGGSPIASQVAYYKLDEGYGSTANNSGSVGSSIAGTLGVGTSAPTWTNSGKFGKALTFDGGDIVNTGTGLNTTWTQMSVSAWFKVSDTNTRVIVSKYCTCDSGYGTSVFSLYTKSGSVYFKTTTTGGTGGQTVSFGSISTGTWYHAVGVWDGAKQYIYVNGVKSTDIKTQTTTMNNTANPIFIGSQSANGGDWPVSQFYGTIDEVKIYSGALSADQVRADYNRGSSLVLGALGNNSSYEKNAANQEYCIPGDSTTCTSPVLEWKLDENTGTSAYDTGSNGYTGTLTLGPTWANGKIGGSVKLDGSDDYVGVGSSAATTNVTNWSLSAWIKPSNLNQLGFAVYNGSDSGGYGFGVSSSGGGSNGGSLIGLFGGVAWITTGYTFTDTNWHHVEMTRDTSTTRFYVDGVRTSSTGSDTPNAVAAKFTVGGEPVGGTLWRYFAGNVDHVRVFNYVRTPAQIAWDYNRGGPIAHYRLDECAGTTAYDASGNGNVGTLSIGSSGANTSAGNCSSGTSTQAWYNGASGKFNSSLKFDGTDDYISIGDTSPLRFDTSTFDFSLFAWVKRTTTGTEYIISKEDADNDGWRMQFNSSNQVLCSEDSTDVTSTSTITDTNWHFIGCTIDRDGNGQVYIDGIANGSAVSMGTDAMATTSSVVIGARSYSATSYFAGLIDDVRIYNYALTSSQIKNIMNDAASVRFGPATGMP